MKDYKEYITKQLSKSIEYSEYLSEQIDRSISYTEYISSDIFSKKYGRMKKIKKTIQLNSLFYV